MWLEIYETLEGVKKYAPERGSISQLVSPFVFLNFVGRHRRTFWKRGLSGDGY
jgi:hypothetical protein